MDPARLSALMSLDPEDRYWHTVDRVAATGVIWRLEAEGSVFTDIAPEGYDFLPIWPERALAQVVADLLYPGKTPKAMSLEQYHGDLMDELTEGGVRIGVFPDGEGAFWACGPLELFDAIDDVIQSRI